MRTGTISAVHTDDPEGLQAHLHTRTPAWASGITGLSVEKIEELARLIGTTKRSFFRIGYGFSRSQRLGQHACRDLHSRRHRRLAA